MPEDGGGLDEAWSRTRTAVLRDAMGIGIATGAYGLTFGALAGTAHLSLPQTACLSLLMFTGASQFAFVGLIAGGGTPLAAAGTAVLLSLRNALYGLRLSSLLEVRGRRKVLAAHLVIDESTAMGLGRDSARAGRLAFWATGAAVFLLWNLATVIGALGAQHLSNPKALGLDAAAPAAFLALVAPRLRSREAWMVAVLAGVVALAVTPWVPAGVPILLAALVAAAAALSRRTETGDRPACEVDA